MVNTATGLLAAGNTESPLRALIYLAVSQHADGGFSQNFWIRITSYNVCYTKLLRTFTTSVTFPR